MPRALLFSDIHNDGRALEQLMNIEAEYYFAAGDLVSWARGLDKMGEIMKRRAGRVYVMPGNHESEQDIETFCARYGFSPFHGRTLEIAGFHIAGLGYSNPTPFDTPGEYTEDEIASRLGEFAAPRDGTKTRDGKKMVLICHAPPLNTALDQIRSGLHAGSRAVRDFIEKYQPEYFFCGHIHEAEGVVIQMGATRAQNVGKKGYLLELPA